MLSNPSLASLGAALQYLLWLDSKIHPSPVAEKMSRRQQFERVMSVIRSYEEEVSKQILEKFNQLDRREFHLFGILNPALVSQRDPTFAFVISDQPPAETKRLFWERYAIQIGDGNHYSAVFYRHYRRESVCRASFAHYNSLEEVKAFLEAVEDLSSQKKESREGEGQI